MHKALLFIFICGIFGAGCTSKEPVPKNNKSPKKSQTDTLKSPSKDRYGIVKGRFDVSHGTVKQNQSLYIILDQLDFSPKQIYGITERAEAVMDPGNFKPGQNYYVYRSDSTKKDVKKIVWKPNPLEYVLFNWKDDSLRISRAAHQLNTKKVAISGTIDYSLYESIRQAGAPPVLVNKLASVFAWQINFFGLRSGDSFKVLYNENFVGDSLLGTGDVLAAGFNHRGRNYQAYKFSKGSVDGYFDSSGKSLEKALLKAPFEYNHRISSGYSHNRLNPVTKKYRPHYGVDFAAPTGTPVLAVGDGRITKANYSGASGNIIKLRHNSTYRTAYLHLHRFADGISPGVRVEQGQVIGYVGSTGRSTGPHLDYRLYKNGSPVNSRTVDLPSSKGVPDSLKNIYKRESKELKTLLKNKTATGRQPRQFTAGPQGLKTFYPPTEE